MRPFQDDRTADSLLLSPHPPAPPRAPHCVCLSLSWISKHESQDRDFSGLLRGSFPKIIWEQAGVDLLKVPVLILEGIMRHRLGEDLNDRSPPESVIRVDMNYL